MSAHAADDDLDLLREWRDGSSDAGSQLFERHFDSLYRFFAYKNVEDELMDLMQQTLLACVEGRDRFRGHSSVRTFLLGIARHKLHDHWRTKTKNAKLDFEVSSLLALEPSPSSVLRRNRSHRLLLEALRGLPLDSQIALELHYWEGLSGPELAEVLGVPEGTVRGRLRRGRVALQKRLTELAESPDRLPTTLTDLDEWARSLRALMD